MDVAYNGEEKKKQEPEDVSDLEERDEVRFTENFEVVDKTLRHRLENLHYAQFNPVIETSKLNNAVAEESLKKTEFNF